MQNTNLHELEQKIGYSFKNINHLKTALTHSSYSNELKLKGITVECNERLEFLGDSVLSIVAATYLFNKYPSYPEGELTRRRAVIVCRDALSSYAKSLNLGDFLFLGNGEGHIINSNQLLLRKHATDFEDFAYAIDFKKIRSHIT